MSKARKTIWILLSVFVFFPIALSIAVSLAGGGSSESASTSGNSESTKRLCDKTSQEMLDTIQSGMVSSKYKLAGRGQVQLTEEQNSELTSIAPGWDKNYVIAANISGGEISAPKIGLWGKSGNTGALFALNDNALKYSEWGTAANEGSPAYQIRLKLLRFGTTQGALDCGK
jgi:hypothetical protein